MKKLILKVVLINLFISCFAIAQRFNTDSFRYVDNVRLNTKTDVAEIMYVTDKKEYVGKPEEIALQFLDENKEVFGIRSISDLNLNEIIESPGGQSVGLIQTFNEIPIFGTETVVSINDKNQIEAVTNGCLPIVDFKSTTPSISKETAFNYAKEKIKLNEKSLVNEPKCELYVYPDSLYQMHLAWKVNMISGEPTSGDWQIFVDAQTGDILETRDLRIFVTGQGKVFKPDPITALQNTSLTDQNDSDYPALQGAYVTVSLPYLNSAVGGLYRLQGTYARSENIIPISNDDLATSPTSSFLYNRSQNGFEETNIYYFLTTQKQYIGSLGFNPKWNGQNYIRFDARGTKQENAWYSPSGKYLIFGVPDNLVDAGEDQDVILHEYTHSVHDALMIGTIVGQSDQRLISEGSADYLALSYRGTISNFQPNRVAPWFVNGEGNLNVRTLSTSYSYPISWTWGNYGILWASTMMDIQNFSGMNRDITTKLLLKSFTYSSPSTIVPDHVYNILLADKRLYSSSHLGSLGKCFESRGFFNARSGVHSSNYISGNINSSTSWNSIKWVNGATYIKNGATVISNGFLFIGDFNTIVIESGGALYIQGHLIKYTGADIFVMPGGTLGFSKIAVSPESNESETPTKYDLLGSYPNPFNPITTIKYSIPKESSVELKIYDIMGREVKTFIINSQPAGVSEIKWDGTNNNGIKVASGVYIYIIKLQGLKDFDIYEKSAKLILSK